MFALRAVSRVGVAEGAGRPTTRRGLVHEGGRRTRLRAAKGVIRLPTRPFERKDKAATGREGFASQPGIIRPSFGRAERMTVRCSASRRRLVAVSATSTQRLTIRTFQPRAVA